ncbi:MAG TPA: hypothetical protein VKG84_13840 [Candidatus Acidoferrales bacterium]|nr:hypothetical protein [Candidatus Acidoferrales bacterium]
MLKLSSRPVAPLAFACAALLLSPLATSSGLSNNDPPLPSAEEVLHKVLATVTSPGVRSASSQFRSVQHTVIEKTDDKGHLREREDRTYDVGPLAGGVYASLVERNGKSLSPTELADERDRRQRFIESRGTLKFGGGDSDRVPLDPELFDRYRAEVVGREWVSGRPAIVLHFWPRSADLPIRRRQDYVLNKLTGKVWVDEQEWEIVRVDANLTERVRVMLGLVAALDKADLSFEQIRMGDSIYLPLKLSANFEGRKLFSTLHERVEVTWTGQRPAGEAPPTPGAAPATQTTGSGKPHP